MPMRDRAGGRRRSLLVVAAAVLLAVPGTAPGGTVAEGAPPGEARPAGRDGPEAAGGGRVRVMTYNVRQDIDPPPRDWASRLPVMGALLRERDPDVLGLQEVRWEQVRDLTGALPEYGRIGVGRRGGTEGEFSAILYRRDRLGVLESGDFWLSDTPAVAGSITWGNTYPRMVTWALLRDRRDGRVFYHVNTHLDHHSAYARVRGARLILERVRAFGAGAAVLLTGDFNTPAGRGEAYRVLTGPDAFGDTWTAARRRGPVSGTYGGWRPPVVGGDRIDWILARGPVRTRWTEIVPYLDGPPPSDHHPVIAHVTIGAAR